MITQIEITNFKRFENRLFRLAPLTVLTGFNGTGKSSFIQSLLMLNQACTGSMEKSTVELNSSGLELGEASNVIRYGSDSDEIRFNMQTDSHAEYEWKFGIPTDRSMYLDIRKAPDSPPPELSCMGRDFTYLSAERLGPRDILGTSSLDTDDLGVGPRGEYVAQLLFVFDCV